ncbi:unnamed protein product [Urochloa humidicola]
MASDKKSDGSPDAACLALRIATVALSVASAAMMASASQHSCSATGCAPASQQQVVSVSYSDYTSLTYSLAATVVSAAAQAAAACLKARKEEGEGKSKAIKSVYELVDAAAQVLLYSSAALAFSVDDFGTCGHRVAGVCKGSGEFCQRVRDSGAVSMAAAVSLAVSKYLKDVPVSTWFKGGKSETKAKPGCGPRGHCHH